MRQPAEKPWRGDPDSRIWSECFEVRGWLGYAAIKNCSLYLIRRDWGDLTSPPEGMWMQWIEDGAPQEARTITLHAGRRYEALIAVRNTRENYACIAEHGFIESDGQVRKFNLPTERPSYISERGGRVTFELEIRSGKKTWRPDHYYSLIIPPPDESNDGFRMGTIDRAADHREF